MDLAERVEELIKLTTSLKEELDELRGKDLNAKVAELEKEMAELRNEINDLRYCLMKQNAKILALIHRQPQLQKMDDNSNESVEMLPSIIQRKISGYSKIFPLATMEDLEDLEKSLDESNTQEIIIILQQLLTPKGIASNISYVLSSEIIMACNINGIHKKKRLLSYTKFIDVLFQAAYTDGYSLKAFLTDMRRGLRIVKNRYFKNKCRTNVLNQVQKSADEYESDNYDDEDDDVQPSHAEFTIKIEDTFIHGD